MQPDANITSTTNQYLASSWVDLVLRDNFIFGQLMKNTKEWDGSQMLMQIKYQKGLPTVAFSGFDVLPISQIPDTVNMVFYPSFTATNIALSGTDLSVNKTKSAVLNLMKVRMESRAQDAADDIGNYLEGDGTSDGGKAPMGLLGIVDTGSDLANYGGLSRATYTGLQATVNTATNSQISLLQLRTTWNSISDGPVRPDLIVTDYSSWAYIEQLLGAFQRNSFSDFKRENSGAGYDSIYWDGMTINRDKKVTTGTLYMLNTRFLHWYGLKWWEGERVSPKAVDIEGNVYDSNHYTPGSTFTWTDWIKAYNQAAINGFIIMGGQLICRAPFRQAKITGITGA